MKPALGTIWVALVSGASLLAAQQPQPTSADPLGGNFFPPELIMQNQQALGLSEEQKGFMITEIQRVQSQATPIQWRLTRELEKLGTLVRPPRVDEAQVLAQLDSLLVVEREMKHTQITLLIRLKNRLTPEQQAYLRDHVGQRDR